MFLASVGAPGGEDVDAFAFLLAEKLGKTLAELEDMAADEYARWKSFHRVRNQQEELAAIRARQATR